MEKFDREIKNFYKDQVSSKTVPPYPGKKKSFSWDNLFLAACILGSLILISQPAIYDNTTRKTYVHISRIDAFKENFPRVIFEGSLYFKQKQGVKND